MAWNFRGANRATGNEILLETAKANGIPGVVHLRSFSLFGLSDLEAYLFADGTDNAWNRERAARTPEPGNSSFRRLAADGHRLELGQPDLLLHIAQSTNPKYDAMELKSIEDWVVEKNLKSVPDIVDVASFGGPTREYQVRVDPATDSSGMV